MSTRSNSSRKKKLPLEQARLAGLDFNFQTVNPRRESTTPSRGYQQKQAGLETFGFISRKAKPIKSRTPTINTESEPEPPQQKRRRVVVRSPKLSQSSLLTSRTSSLSPPPSSLSPPPSLIDHHLLDDREIAETQFAQPDPESNNEPDPVIADSDGGVPELFLTPIPAPLKLQPLQMLPPPTTPKRRKILEIPSSHSPPVTPISPYKSPSVIRFSQKSPLFRHRSLLKSPSKSPSKWRLSGQVASSQWWENDEDRLTQGFTQGFTQGPTSPELGEDDDDGEEDDFFNQTFHAGRLFQTDRARGHFSQFEETQPATSRFTYEEGFDTPYISLIDEWEDRNMEKGHGTVALDTPQSSPKGQKSVMSSGKSSGKMDKGPQQDELELFPRSTQTQNRRESQISAREDIVIPESPLTSPQGGRMKMISEGNGRARAASQFPRSGNRTASTRTVPVERHCVNETQEESEWEALPETTLRRQCGKAKVDTDSLTERKNKNGDSTGKSGVEEGIGKPGIQELVLDSDYEIPTMSQLLPETLMESFPMPPPLTQWSSQLNWTPGEVDDDEL